MSVQVGPWRPEAPPPRVWIGYLADYKVGVLHGQCSTQPSDDPGWPSLTAWTQGSFTLCPDDRHAALAAFDACGY